MTHLDDTAALLRIAPLRSFVETMWAIAEPAAPFIPAWHVDAVCDFLEAWHRREFQYGVLNQPPGTGKSMLVDVMYQAWAWAQEPGRKFLCCSYDLDLCLRDADKIDAIMRSDLYRAAFPDAELRPVTAKSNLWTTLGGFRFSTTPDGKGGTGRHFHDVSINDPVKVKDVSGAELGAQLERAHRWIDVTMPSRRADPKRFGAMLTMQRLVEKDPAGVALDRGWAHLCLPMRYEPRAHWIRGEWSARLDQRGPGLAHEGEQLLHPARWDEASVKQLESSLAHHASAQLQQNPIPRTGGLIEEPHLAREWVEVPRQGYFIQVWDFAAKGTEATHSAVHGALWCAAEVDTWRTLVNTLADRERGAEPVHVLERGPRETRYLLVDEVWGIWDVPESERQFERAQDRQHWSRSSQRIIEAKAAGIGIIQRYQRTYTGVVAFHEIDDECKALAQLDKLDRLRANLVEWHAHRVLLPPWRRTVADRVDPSDGPGPDAYRRELCAFPRGARDDRADTSSMALARLVQGTQRYWANVRALRKQISRGETDWG